MSRVKLFLSALAISLSASTAALAYPPVKIISFYTCGTHRVDVEQLFAHQHHMFHCKISEGFDFELSAPRCNQFTNHDMPFVNYGIAFDDFGRMAVYRGQLCVLNTWVQE